MTRRRPGGWSSRAARRRRAAFDRWAAAEERRLATGEPSPSFMLAAVVSSALALGAVPILGLTMTVQPDASREGMLLALKVLGVVGWVAGTLLTLQAWRRGRWLVVLGGPLVLGGTMLLLVVALLLGGFSG